MNPNNLNLRQQAIQKFQEMTGLPAGQTNEIFDMFFDSLPDNRAKLIEYMKSSDNNGIFQVAHKLRGTAGSLMIDDIFKISDTLEKNTKASNEQAVKDQTVELIAAIDLYLD